MEIFKQFTFDSAHFLPHVPIGHKCKEMHGHTYKLSIFLEGNPDTKMGWLMDFNDLKKVVEPVIAELDHKVLNNVSGLENPTCENMCIWLWNKLKPSLPMLSKIELYETPTSGAVYTGE